MARLELNGHPPTHHLILGGCGFIGRHVALLLARSGIEVTLAGPNEPNFSPPPALAARIRWVRFDLATADWDALAEGVSTIHHYAWTTVPASANADPAADLAANVLPTVRLLEALRRRRERLGWAPTTVFASSGGTVYGRLRRVPAREDDALAPITAYGVSKVAVEFYLNLYRTLHGLDCRVARLANPFGAGQDVSRGQGAVTAFLDHALRREPIVVWGDGEVVRDYVHILDAVAGLVALALAPPLEERWIFNVGSGRGVSLNGVLAELELRLGRPLEVRRVAGRPFDVPTSVLDVSRAREVLGWGPKLSFGAGVTRTLADLEAGAGYSAV